MAAFGRLKTWNWIAKSNLKTYSSIYYDMARLRTDAHMWPLPHRVYDSTKRIILNYFASDLGPRTNLNAARSDKQ